MVHLTFLCFNVALVAAGVDGDGNRASRTGGGAHQQRFCNTDADCSLAGDCSAATNQCVCDPGFEGPTCAALAFKPASAAHPAAFRPGHGFTTWGGSPIQADNKSMYYLFASVNFKGTLADWWNTSVIVTATSTSPGGPYAWDRKTITIGPSHKSNKNRQSTAEGAAAGAAVDADVGADGVGGSQSHPYAWDTKAVQNPVVVRLKHGAGFVIYYAGSNLTTPHFGMTNSAIMAAHSKSLDGPWSINPAPALLPYTSKESWEAGAVCNPAAYVHDDNSVTLAYRGYWDNNGVAFAWAPSWHGPFTRLYGGSGLFAERPTLEDPFLFATPRGLHVLMHYFRADNCTAKAAEAGKDAKKVCANVGNHAFAPSVPRLLPGNNGAATGTDVEFFLAPPSGPMAGGYSAAVRFDNNTDVAFSHREEPKMLLEWSDAAGDYVPTYLFNVVVENQVPPSNGWAHLESYIFAQPLAGNMQPPSHSNISVARSTKGRIA